jgi:arylsulfatase A-like enzyme
MKILVIEALGLHLGNLGCYGNDWVATPNLDRLASQGVVFDWHIAEQPGANGPCCPAQTRVIHCEELSRFADDAKSALAANDNLLWIAGPSLLPPWRLDDELLDAYFDEDDVEEGLLPWRDPPFALVKLNDAEIVQLQNTYAAVVTFFDAQVGELLAHVDEDALICVTARSGMPLGEHGMIGTPEPRLHDELVHVPLIMRLPHGMDAGTRIAALTQPADLTPTFLESLGQASGERSLWPLMRGEVEAIRPFAVSTLRVGDQESWLMRTLDRALHVAVTPADRPAQLFLKPEDRWEMNNLYQQQVEIADEMEVALRAFLKVIGPAH